MFEHRSHPPLSTRRFVSRMVGSVVLAVVLTLVSLLVGVLGYHELEGLSWVDALLNASMILGGMGPVDALKNTQAKLFASLYALYSGLLMIACMGIMLAPVIHRIMHRLHADAE